MRSVGVDIAGGGIAAVALAVNGIPKSGAIWQPEKKESEATKLLMWSRWLDIRFRVLRPDIISVEELAVFMNKKVIRSLSKFEGVALLQAKKQDVIVVNPPVTQAR